MMRTNAEIKVLRTLLTDALVARAAGATQPRLARLQGYVDGYMRALVESKAITERELIQIVREVRAEFGGPALAVIEPEAFAAA
jgi:hypothetical protein